LPRQDDKCNKYNPLKTRDWYLLHLSFPLYLPVLRNMGFLGSVMKGGAKVTRDGGFKLHRLACHGMIEGQAEGMQTHA